MKVALTNKATARQIAELHRRIEEARLAIIAIEAPIDGSRDLNGRSNPLARPTREWIRKLNDHMHNALLSLESPLMHAADSYDAPCVTPRDPNAWHRWLDAKEMPQCVKVKHVPAPPPANVMVKPVFAKPGAST